MSWLWRKKKPNEQPDFLDVVSAYGAVLEEGLAGMAGSRSEDDLPYDKATIKSALTKAAIFHIFSNEDNSQDMVEAIGVSFVLLASFVPNGGKPSPMFGLAENIENMSPDEIREFARQMPDSGEERAILEKITADSKALLDEWESLKAAMVKPHA